MRKIRHFFLTTLAVLCSTLTTWADPYGGTPAAPTQISGNYANYDLSADYDGYYVISTAEELYGFAELVNNGSNSAGYAKAVLTDDIVVNLNVPADGNLNGATMHSWTPIGTTSKSFKGTFDGNGHTISGLYFENTTNDKFPYGGNYVGLIGYADGATIKNVGVVDSYIKGNYGVGGICGDGGSGTQTNCYNTGTVSGSSTFVGGICGKGGTQTNCYNTGTVSGSSSYVGGICGGHGTQTNCYNTGMVSGSNDVGGICGYDGTTTNCYNTGSVSGTKYVGGICGGGSIYSKQTKCYNTGTVSGSSNNVGGICGYGGTQTNCYNTGTVSGSSYSVGGISAQGGTQTNCYYLAGCAKDGSGVVQNGVGNGTKGKTTADNLGMTISSTTDDFANGKVTYGLNGSTSEGNLVWYQTIGTDALPVWDNTHAVVFATQPCPSFSNDENNTHKEHPLDATGHCTDCGQFVAQGTLVTESNYSSYGLTADFIDYYAISNSGELYWLAKEVNNGNATINAVLTADIVVNLNVPADGNLNGATMYSWTPIGTKDKPFAGTFDGNGHTISGLYFENTTNSNYPDGGNYVGLIGYANGAKIKNVGVIDSYLRGYQYVGGICGYGYNTNTNITNCYNTGTVSGSSTFVGGICGINGTQTNCYNTGTVSGSSSVGGICGYSGTQTNCYYLAGCGNKNTLGTFVSAKDVANGRLTYLLNGSTSEGNLTWYQTLGEDKRPLLDNTRGVVFTSNPCPFNNNSNGIVEQHNFINGLCTKCGEGEEPNSVNGVYQIANAGQLYWFANEVNNGNTTINAVLTEDITVNTTVIDEDGHLIGTPTHSWTPIGTSSKPFAGTFDGNGHTISGLYFNNPTVNNYPDGGKYVGLIGYGHGATIKNVGVIDSYLRGYEDVGGICGYSGTQTNCYNTGTVSGSYCVGGICGIFGTQTYCYNTGTVSGTSYYAGGICGDRGTQTNCYNTGAVSGPSSVGGICGNGGNQTNCYYLAGCAKDGNNVVQYGVGNGTKGRTTADVAGNTISATTEEFASGKITYRLNGSTSEGNLVWYQTIGTDALPVWDNTHAVVYASQPCATAFSNTEGAVKEHPLDATGYCTACGQYIAQGTLVDESNYSSYGLTADFIGYYAISNSGELYWFAKEVNNGNATINAVLTADIVVNLNVPADGNLNGATMYSWTPIGTKDKPFAGTFDGNGHTISGLYFENTTNSNYPDGGNYVGLIGYAKGSGGNGAIKNVGVIDSYIHGCQYVGGICGQAGVFTYDGYFPITITNCYNTGTISGSSSYVGGICGYEGTTTNCYNTGTVSGSDEYVGGICGCSGAQINCYYLAGCGSKNTLGVSATTAEFESGKITYLLNGRTSGDDNTWRQNRGGDADAYPVLDKNHLVVYASQPCTVTFSNTEGAVIPHSSVDEITGYCPVCCQFTVHGTLVTESNRNSLNLTANFVGYYAISNSGELYWFANEVNSGNNTINAVLTADIEVNKNLLNDDGTVNGTPTNWAPIGSFYDFRGTFDGNGHTISGLYFSEPTIDNVGLIGFAYRATIKNVGVIDSYLHGHNSVGGICGYDYYLSKITNCYNTGSVSGYDGVGGIYGYSDDYSTTATNCFNTGSVSGYDGVGGIVGAGNTPTNCYYLADCGSKNTLGTSATAEEFANGKITYLLNGSTSEGNLTWRQTLGDGNDAHPVLDKTHAVVYATQPCASGFSNTSGDVNPHPSSMDAIGRCTACGKFIAQGTLVTESNYSSLNLSADFVGYYAISNSGELYWLANEVNNGNATINAVLTADIVVNENVLNADGTLNGTPTYSWTPIGTYSKNYKGTFDGNGHTISGLYFNNTANSNYPDGGINVGLIGYANGAEIKNVGVINSYLVGRYYVGGICGYGSSSTTITNCYNTGTVWGDTNYGGGICGFGSSSTTITNCYNTGTITGFHYVGGICSSGGTQTNCHNTGKVSGTYYVGGICGSGGTQTNCYYLSGCATGGINVVQYGVGNGTWGQTTADVAGKTTAATAEEFASGKIGYLLNTNNNNAWHQNLYSDGYPVLDNTHNFVSGYIEEEGDTYTVVGDMFLATNYEVAAGKTLSVPAGTSLTTTGEAVITNNGTIVFNGTIAGNNLAGNGTFITNRLSLCSISNLSESYVYKGSAYTLEDGLQDVAVNTTILGKTFTLDATISSPSYTNNRYVGTATISWTNNADENDVLSGRFEITPKEVELVWKNTTLTYNGSAQKPTATATGMVNDESLAVSVSGAQTNAGTYTATATGLSNSNYKLPTTVTQQFSIEPKTGVVVTITENSSELAYNTEEQSVSGYTVSIDDELGIYSENDFEFSGTAAVAGTTVGTYPMELSAADFSNTNANFADVEFVIVDGALTINKAPEAPNKPEAAMSTLFVNTQLIELPAGWAWTESKALEEGANTAIAEYTGADAGNYEIERVEIAITRNHCDHNGETAMLYIVEATCTEQGYSGNLSCALCGEIYEYGHTTDALGHDFVNTIVAPTCTAEGYTQHLCSRCQHVEYSDTVAANGHKADSIVFENIVAATCTVAGSKDSVVYCSVCKAELSRKTVVIDATGHKADSVIFENIVAATCSAAGSKDSVVYCSVCKAEVSRTKVTLPATGHTVVVDSAVAATATTDGLTEGSHCSVCGETIVAQEVIPATGEQGGEENGNEGGNENNGGNNQGGNENNGGNENQGGNNEGGNENQGGENTEPATAIADDAAPAVNIYAYQNIIVVENATDEIRVYNAMGTLVYRDAARHISTTATITVNGQGVYIVKTGNVAKRVMIY